MTIQMQYGNESSATASQWWPYRSYDVIIHDVTIGLKTFTSITGERIEIESWARCHCVSLWGVLSWHIGRYGTCPARVRSFGMISGQIFKFIFRGQNAYVLMPVNARNATVLSVFSTFISSKVIYKRVDITKERHFCLTCHWKFKIWAKAAK